MGTGGGSSASSWLCTEQHGVITFHKTEFLAQKSRGQCVSCKLQWASSLVTCYLLLLFVGSSSSRDILAKVQAVYDPHA